MILKIARWFQGNGTIEWYCGQFLDRIQEKIATDILWYVGGDDTGVLEMFTPTDRKNYQLLIDEFFSWCEINNLDESIQWTEIEVESLNFE